MAVWCVQGCGTRLCSLQRTAHSPAVVRIHVQYRSICHCSCRCLQYNTKRGIETCGILAGELDGSDDTFTVTNLVIPHQKGEPNNVEMHGEEHLAEYVLSRDLIQLGWIHSHPTQTCFLSSIDVHTHCPYQVCFRHQASCWNKSCHNLQGFHLSCESCLSLLVLADVNHSIMFASVASQTTKRDELQTCKPDAGVSARGGRHCYGAHRSSNEVRYLPANHAWWTGPDTSLSRKRLSCALQAINWSGNL